MQKNYIKIMLEWLTKEQSESEIERVFEFLVGVRDSQEISEEVKMYLWRQMPIDQLREAKTTEDIYRILTEMRRRRLIGPNGLACSLLRDFEKDSNYTEEHWEGEIDFRELIIWRLRNGHPLCGGRDFLRRLYEAVERFNELGHTDQQLRQVIYFVNKPEELENIIRQLEDISNKNKNV